jgi:hypothetical protein
MRTAHRLAAALTVALLLAGCGSDATEAGPAEDQTTGEPSDQTSETLPPGPVDFTLVRLISESNAEGESSPRPTVLDNRTALEDFAGQFSGAAMPTALSREYARADLPDGEVLLGAVVDISCKAPSEVEVEQTKRGIKVTAVPEVSKVEVQCLVPVTTVALVSVPEAAV